MPIFEKQERSTMFTKALKQIRRAIKSGKLKSGDRLIESRLAEEMQISRFPIREAIRYLEKEGLVVTIPFKGAYVANFGERDLEEVYTLRSALEELAVRKLMESLDSKKIEKLDSILKMMKKASQEGKIDKLVSVDMKFHRTICELSDHRKLLDMWLTLEHQLRTFITLEEHLYKEPDALVKTHYPVIKDIKSGDIKRAEESIRKHLYNALNIIKHSYIKTSAHQKNN